MTTAVEVNFDGLVGPTHHYGGLAPGNLASIDHRGQVSRPRDAALEGLAKMKHLMDVGVPQAVLPPQPRPDLHMLRSLGFAGDDASVLRAALRDAPGLLSSCSSASSMWAANAATVSPSADTHDGRVHITPANLLSNLHRALEAPVTLRLLRAIFGDERHFAVHAALPSATRFADEGAANHTRLCAQHGDPGVHLFVHGGSGTTTGGAAPRRHPVRQARATAEAIARRHGLAAAHVVCAQQHPDAIDAGVFHNDVIAVGNRNALLHHEYAFVDTDAVVAALDAACTARGCGPLRRLEVLARDFSLEDAVATYLFNSQLVDLPGGGMMMLCPSRCATHEGAQRQLDRWLAGDHPIERIDYVDLGQSMNNGGGPACLRLRVVLTPLELEAMHPAVMLDEQRHAALVTWVTRHYREQLTLEDLADPQLRRESDEALDQLTQLLELGSLYRFQR